ncbi:MAG: hypothetical protein JOZ52_02160 [Acidobacteria bacterium]|nr:hypothetical protein [Acidobacteriota bacterium]
MRYFIRLMIALLAFATGLTATGIWNALQPSARQAASDSYPSVTISPVKFYEWRRAEQPAGLYLDDSDEAPPPASYYQIQTLSPDDSQTGMVDIVCQLENRGSQPVDLLILATGDLLVSPKEIMGTESERQQLPLLTERENIGEKFIRGLAPGEKREVRFENFSLKLITNKYLRGGYGSLRPNGFKVVVDVRMAGNLQMACAGGLLKLNFGR